MSNYVEYGRFRAFQKQVRKTIINFHINGAPKLRAQGQSPASDDPALADDTTVQATARATQERRRQRLRCSSSSSRWWLLLVGLITAVLCLPFIRMNFVITDEAVLLNGAERMLR